MSRVYALSGLIACVVAVATTLVTMRLSGPAAVPSPATAPSPAPGPRAAGDSSPWAPATVVLEGVAEVPVAKSREEPADLEVFYKAPFASPPHLTFPDGLRDDCRVVDQKATGFKLRRTEISGLTLSTVKWRAEGQPGK